MARTCFTAAIGHLLIRSIAAKQLVAGLTVHSAAARIGPSRGVFSSSCVGPPDEMNWSWKKAKRGFERLKQPGGRTTAKKARGQVGVHCAPQGVWADTVHRPTSPIKPAGRKRVCLEQSWQGGGGLCCSGSASRKDEKAKAAFFSQRRPRRGPPSRNHLTSSDVA